MGDFIQNALKNIYYLALKKYGYIWLPMRKTFLDKALLQQNNLTKRYWGKFLFGKCIQSLSRSAKPRIILPSRLFPRSSLSKMNESPSSAWPAFTSGLFRPCRPLIKKMIVNSLSPLPSPYTIDKPLLSHTILLHEKQLN